MKNSLLLLAISLIFLRCSNAQNEHQSAADSFMIAAWTGAGMAESEAEWREKFQMLTHKTRNPAKPKLGPHTWWGVADAV